MTSRQNQHQLTLDMHAEPASTRVVRDMETNPQEVQSPYAGEPHRGGLQDHTQIAAVELQALITYVVKCPDKVRGVCHDAILPERLSIPLPWTRSGYLGTRPPCYNCYHPSYSTGLPYVSNYNQGTVSITPLSNTEPGDTSSRLKSITTAGWF